MSINEPLLTRELSREEFSWATGATYIHGTTPESRSELDRAWIKSGLEHGVKFVEVVSEDASGQAVFVGLSGAESDHHCSMWDLDGLLEILEMISDPIVLDITGLTYSTWAALLRACISVQRRLSIVYVEPLDYVRSAKPTPGAIFDLSNGFAGIGPLPGMARIAVPSGAEDSIFVPLLGFEGGRFGHMVSHVDPPPRRVFPVVGVPGFRPEFPFYSFAGNREGLESDFVHRNVIFAKANCPFDLFHELDYLARRVRPEIMRIAPVGTKPHGLGAVLYALSRDNVELIYDHPIRSSRRTVGASRLCLYDIAGFIESDLFKGEGVGAP